MNEENSIYLQGDHEGWIINILPDGIEIVSPAIGKLQVNVINTNTVQISEKK